MRIKQLSRLLIALSVLLTTAAWLVACDGATEGNETSSTTEYSSESVATTVDYTVTVLDYKGSVPDKDVIVELKQGDTSVATKRMDKNGQVVFNDREKGDYTFVLLQANDDVLHYDTAACVFSSEKTEVTVTVYNTSQKTMTIHPTFGESGDRSPYEATYVKEGATYVKIDREGQGYYVFRPERSGVYRFSCISAETVIIGYFGEPYNVLSSSTADPEQVGQGYFEVVAENVTIGQVGGSLAVVIGLNSDTATDAVLVVERVGEPEKKVPWNMVQAKQIPVDFPVTDGDTAYLVDISVTNRDATIVKGDDGFYHYGTTDGPIVYCRVKSDNRYTPAFVTMCETDMLGSTVIEDGIVVEKDAYNELFNAYGEKCDENGLCPLTDELITAIQKTGDNKGWWNFENNIGNVFITDASGNQTGINADNFVMENAYLFACCFVAPH